MPFAKVDVAFIRDHFAAVPEKNRPAAIALYLQLVLTSAELLLDGRLPRTVLEAGGAEIGISRGRYARREIASAATSLCEIGLLEEAGNGTFTLTRWADHHSSRDGVDQSRKAAAERKRRSRDQLTLGVAAAPPVPNVTAMSQRDTPRDSRAHARAGAATDTEVLDPTAAVGTTPAAADLVENELTRLGLTDRRVIAEALHDPDRAQAWIDHARTHSTTNAAGYVRRGLESGQWPSNGTRPARPPAHRREAFVRTSGWQLDDEHLEDELAHMGADLDEMTALVELAHTLREKTPS